MTQTLLYAARIRVKDEGAALWAAAAIKKGKPDGTEMSFTQDPAEKDVFHINLYCARGRELVVQRFVRDVAPNLRGYVGSQFGLD